MLRWDFKKDYIGYVHEKHIDKDGNEVEWIYSIYTGNALATVLYEYEKDGEMWYNLHWFLCDKEHLKNIVKADKEFFSGMSFTLQPCEQSKEIAKQLFGIAEVTIVREDVKLPKPFDKI